MAQFVTPRDIAKMRFYLTYVRGRWVLRSMLIDALNQRERLKPQGSKRCLFRLTTIRFRKGQEF
jgi:hypothetical protein